MLYNSHLSSSVEPIMVGKEEGLVDIELRTLLQEYLVNERTLDDLRNWVALKIWDAPADQYNEVDDLAIELAHLDDGLADEPEQYFRVQVWALLGDFGVGTVKVSKPYVEFSEVTSGATYVPSPIEDIPYDPTVPLQVNWQTA